MEPHEVRQVDDIVVKEKSEAEAVLKRLKDLITLYHYATISDYYDLCDLPGIYLDNMWGWDNLDEVTIEEVEDGFKLNLPTPKQTYKFGR